MPSQRLLQHGVTISFVLMLLVGLGMQNVQARMMSLPDFTVLAEQNSPVVVNISTTKHTKNREMPHGLQGIPEPFLKYFFGLPGMQDHFGGHQGQPREEVSSLGSGFIISSDGYILTNNHVVEEADDILVRMANRQELKAKIVGTDPSTDVALIKVEANDLPVAKIGVSAKLKVGQWVLAIGSPFGLDHTVSHGIVSALGRALPDDTYVPFIQTDVPINPGNSGGPLFNLDGKVVGINAQIYSKSGGSMGLSFSIPIDIAMNVAQQLKDKGKVTRGFLGVQVQEVSGELAESFGLDKPKGALVAETLPDTPAEMAGVQAGDIILEFNGKSILKSSDLPPIVGASPVGKSLSMKVVRNGREKTLKVTLKPLNRQDVALSMQSRTPSTSSWLGAEVQSLSDEQLAGLNLPFGVKIAGLKADSVAAQAGIRSGDVLVSINFKPIKSPEQFSRLLERLPKGRSLPMRVVRGKRSLFLPIVLP